MSAPRQLISSICIQRKSLTIPKENINQNHDKMLLRKRGTFKNISMNDERNMITIQHHIDRKCRFF